MKEYCEANKDKISADATSFSENMIEQNIIEIIMLVIQNYGTDQFKRDIEGCVILEWLDKFVRTLVSLMQAHDPIS